LALHGQLPRGRHYQHHGSLHLPLCLQQHGVVSPELASVLSPWNPSNRKSLNRCNETKRLREANIIQFCP
jgi:hypothetical protein